MTMPSAAGLPLTAQSLFFLITRIMRVRSESVQENHTGILHHPEDQLHHQYNNNKNLPFVNRLINTQSTCASTAYTFNWC